MTLDKFEYYTKAAVRREVHNRQKYVIDTVGSIAMAFTGKGLDDYMAGLNEMLLESSKNGKRSRPPT